MLCSVWCACTGSSWGAQGWGSSSGSEPSLIKLISHGGASAPWMNNPDYKTPLSTFSHLYRAWKGELLGLLQPNGLCQQGRGDRAPGALGQAGHVCWKDEIPERECVCVYIPIYTAPKNHFTTTFWPQQLCLKSNKRWRNFSTQIIRDPGGDTGLWTLITNAK